ncbi:hypothetical protein GF406_03910 [candidate division KSB1 bacterium]|nr:hypothetical protein [candidate division KSB1 bacterium]
MIKLYFNFKDLFRAPRIAGSLQRMWIQLLGLFMAYAGYLILTYAGYLVNGHGLATVWQKYGLTPCSFSSGESFSILAWVVFILANLWFVLMYLIGATAVARAAYMQAKGNAFYSWKEAFNFALRKSISIIMTPVSLLLLIGLFFAGGWIVGLLGKIPFVGEIGISLFTVLWFVFALIIVLFMIMLVATLFLVPGILASTDEDAFEAIFQTFSLVWSQPFRFIGYLVLNTLLAFAALAVFAVLVKQGIVLMNAILISSMGADYINLSHNGQAIVQSWLLWGQQGIEAVMGKYTTWVYFSHPWPLLTDLSTSVVVSSYLYALGLIFIGGWVVSYGFASFNVGNLLSFLIIRKIKDDENLLERVDREEEEEEEEEEEGQDNQEMSSEDSAE